MNEPNLLRRMFFLASDDLSIIDVFEYIVFISNAAAPTEYRIFDDKLIKEPKFYRKVLLYVHWVGTYFQVRY